AVAPGTHGPAPVVDYGGGPIVATRTACAAPAAWSSAVALQGCAWAISFLPRAEAAWPRDRSSGRDLVRVLGRDRRLALPTPLRFGATIAWVASGGARLFLLVGRAVLVAGNRRVAEQSHLAQRRHDSVSP